MAKNSETPNPEALTAKELELADREDKIKAAEARIKASSRNAINPESLAHPNAFMGQDGRTYYKYKMDDAGETLVTPKPIEEMSIDDFAEMPLSMFDSSIGRIPQNLTVTFKDPQWAAHWFNKKARDGYRVSEGRSMGYTPVLKEDLKSYFAGLNDKDGAIEQYDLVCMKIHKGRLYAKLAEYIQKAKMRGSINGYKNEAVRSMPAGGKPGMVGFYHSDQALSEVQGLGRALGE